MGRRVVVSALQLRNGLISDRIAVINLSIFQKQITVKRCNLAISTDWEDSTESGAEAEAEERGQIKTIQHPALMILRASAVTAAQVAAESRLESWRAGTWTYGAGDQFMDPVAQESAPSSHFPYWSASEDARFWPRGGRSLFFWGIWKVTWRGRDLDTKTTMTPWAASPLFPFTSLSSLVINAPINIYVSGRVPTWPALPHRRERARMSIRCDDIIRRLIELLWKEDRDDWPLASVEMDVRAAWTFIWSSHGLHRLSKRLAKAPINPFKKKQKKQTNLPFSFRFFFLGGCRHLIYVFTRLCPIDFGFGLSNSVARLVFTSAANDVSLLFARLWSVNNPDKTFVVRLWIRLDLCCYFVSKHINSIVAT